MNRIKDFCSVMSKALKSPVTENVRQEINAVLDLDSQKMTAQQAVVYAQIAKAIKGDKSAFEAVSNAVKDISDSEDGNFKVEVKVVD